MTNLKDLQSELDAAYGCVRDLSTGMKYVSDDHMIPKTDSETKKLVKNCLKEHAPIIEKARQHTEIKNGT